MILVVAACGALGVLLIWVGAARHYMDVMEQRRVRNYWKWASGDSTFTYTPPAGAQVFATNFAMRAGNGTTPRTAKVTDTDVTDTKLTDTELTDTGMTDAPILLPTT